jgi:HSP20 family protein
MRMRYRHLTYRYTDASPKQLEQRYRQLFDDAIRQSQHMLHRSSTWRPLADIREAAEYIMVTIELAGMKEEEIEVTLYEDALVISGERRNESEQQENAYYHQAQIHYGPFRVEVLISVPIERDAVTARYENGLLWVTLPKAPASERVPIQRQSIQK